MKSGTDQRATHRRFVVIGNGIAGLTAAAEIRRCDRTCAITLVGAETLPTYQRPLLTAYLSVDIGNDILFVHPEQWYREKQIDLLLGNPATEIRTAQQKVVLADGRCLDYDGLIIATGARSVVPPLPGVDKEGIFTLRTLADAKQIVARSRGADRAVIIGGGLLGLAAAWELLRMVLEVTVIEAAPHLLPQQLDEEGAALVAAKAAAAGIGVRLGRTVTEILGETQATGVKLQDGEVIAADLILFAVGVRPNIELAAQAGIATNRGIVVDGKMQTSVPHIYAAGDVAEYDGSFLATWSHAIEQGKIAGANAAGAGKEYHKIIPVNTLTAMNTQLFACGDLGRNPDTAYQTLAYKDAEQGIYRKFYFRRGKLVGGILLGEINKSLLLQESIQTGRAIEACSELLI